MEIIILGCPPNSRLHPHTGEDTRLSSGIRQKCSSAVSTASLIFAAAAEGPRGPASNVNTVVHQSRDLINTWNTN